MRAWMVSVIASSLIFSFDSRRLISLALSLRRAQGAITVSAANGLKFAKGDTIVVRTKANTCAAVGVYRIQSVVLDGSSRRLFLEVRASEILIIVIVVVHGISLLALRR